MVNLEIKLKLENDLQLPNYVWVNDEDEREGCEWLDVSVNEDDFAPFVDFLEYNKDVVISFKMY